MTIKLQMNTKLLVKKKVRIKTDNWSTPGPGYLNEGAVIQINGTPTYISDVPFIVLQGSGEIVNRGTFEDTKRKIEPGDRRFFLSEGHSTRAPYDWGTLDAKCFEVLDA